MGNIQITNDTIVIGNQVTINGTMLPPAPCKGNNSTVVDGNVFLDGYEFKKGKWRRTLRALWHMWF